MRVRKADKNFLHTFLILNLLAIFPILLRKPPLKDWLLVFLFDAFTNGLADRFIVAHNFVSYNVRLLPKVFKTHVLFDYLISPTFTVLFNQFTAKDRPAKIVIKLVLLLIPLSSFEFLAVKYTRLITWKPGWKWYYSFVTLTLKSLIIRAAIGLVRRIDSKE
ncbi:CBO0543 family protein [Bacillus sp. FJAT-27251]|uniref:CBO0543 family protein n=1 Tax=Bacillus sp. FJAT-27251 TaxID=1684142 RepID=UPI0006A79401|nr:CBO0543 family protein [Bacillus sp. FJAT-27251]